MSLAFVLFVGVIALAAVIGFILWLFTPDTVVVVEDNGVPYDPNYQYRNRPFGTTVIVENDVDYVVPAILAAEGFNAGFGYNNTVIVEEPDVDYVDSVDLDVLAVPQADTYYAPDLDVPAVPQQDTYTPDLDVPSVPDDSSWSDNSGGGGGSDW
jgi:hypothetical protein